MSKILIVEDEAEIRNVYAYELGRAGYEVVQAGDAPEGLQALQDERPQVVLLDMLLPGMSGLDFLKQAKARGYMEGVHVIALSNIDTPRVIAEAKTNGADEYCVKVNVTPHALLDLVKKYAAA